MSPNIFVKQEERCLVSENCYCYSCCLRSPSLLHRKQQFRQALTNFLSKLIHHMGQVTYQDNHIPLFWYQTSYCQHFARVFVATVSGFFLWFWEFLTPCFPQSLSLNINWKKCYFSIAIQSNLRAMKSYCHTVKQQLRYLKHDVLFCYAAVNLQKQFQPSFAISRLHHLKRLTAIFAVWYANR